MISLPSMSMIFKHTTQSVAIDNLTPTVSIAGPSFLNRQSIRGQRNSPTQTPQPQPQRQPQPHHQHQRPPSNAPKPQDEPSTEVTPGVSGESTSENDSGPEISSHYDIRRTSTFESSANPAGTFGEGINMTHTRPDSHPSPLSSPPLPSPPPPSTMNMSGINAEGLLSSRVNRTLSYTDQLRELHEMQFEQRRMKIDEVSASGVDGDDSQSAAQSILEQKKFLETLYMLS